jgi:hypothetical protein
MSKYFVFVVISCIVWSDCRLDASEDRQHLSKEKWDLETCNEGAQQRTGHCNRDDMDHKRTALLDWVRLHGKGFNKVEMRDDEYGGTALFATEDIAENELIGTVPYNLTFSLESVHLSGPMHLLLRDLYQAPQTPPELITSMFLIHEASRGADSFFAPYIAMLPSVSQLTGALFWTEETARCAPLNMETRSRAEHLRGYFERVHERFATYVLRSSELRQYGAAAGFDPALYTRERILWAFALIMSRAWSDIAYQRRKSFYRMVPIADIANHKSHPAGDEERSRGGGGGGGGGDGGAVMTVELNPEDEAVYCWSRAGGFRRGEEIRTR